MARIWSHGQIATASMRTHMPEGKNTCGGKPTCYSDPFSKRASTSPSLHSCPVKYGSSRVLYTTADQARLLCSFHSIRINTDF